MAWAGRALIALGLALRARQYATNRSLWLDEAFLAGAILGRPWRMLLADLPNVQVAPIGFIAMERFLVALLGPAEWVLRLVPFVAGCAALPMTRALASRAIGPVAALAPLAIVATSRAAVYYSSEFKQYSTDLFVCTGLVLLAARLRDRPARPGAFAALCIAGTLAPWFSHPSLFVLGGIGLVLAVDALVRRDASQGPRLALLAGAFLASFALLYATSLSRDVADARMQVYWSRQGCLAPPARAAFPAWLEFVARRAMVEPLGLAGRVRLASWLALAGSAFLVARRRWWAGVLLLPLVFVVAAAALRLYPCCQRLILFTVPFLAILVGAGLAALYALPTGAGRWIGSLAGSVAAILLASRAGQSSIEQFRHPETPQNLRPVMERLAAQWQPGDALVLTFPAAPAARYYASRFGIGPIRGDWDRAMKPVVGSLWEDSFGKLGSDPPRGRNWVVFTGRGQEKFAADLLAEMDLVARRIRTIREDDSEAVLFDFGVAPPATGAGR